MTPNRVTPKIIASLIKNTRAEWKLSQRKFAAELNVSHSSIDKWESGDPLDAGTLFKISQKAKTPRAQKLALSCLRLRYPEFQINRKEPKPVPQTSLNELEPA